MSEQRKNGWKAAVIVILAVSTKYILRNHYITASFVYYPLRILAASTIILRREEDTPKGLSEKSSPCIVFCDKTHRNDPQPNEVHLAFA